ncbi:helix-turn-helix domain-containing protein [Streptomyces sp. NPDC048172]|uniref:helix-turn-helix domain-containing protein n=1 Tax=Streptomyces sp. NPDC048172 TaxID=3365505 RepID=UPI0037220AB6
MNEERSGQTPALIELCRRLADGKARKGLKQTQIAQNAHLSRTTVSEAFSPHAPLPSEATVAALGRALRLPVEELLELRRAASEDPCMGDREGPGRPIGEWEPHALEVHPAGPIPQGSGADAPQRRVLPGYVPRDHDRVLAEAVRQVGQGHSRIVVLVGSSSTGKTRACWEAVQPLADQGWWLWHPFDPTRTEAALEELHRVRPRTVMWLNEAQHYLGDSVAGERIAAAVHDLLTRPERGPVLVLGTLWPEYDRQYTALPTLGGEDAHSRVREVLAGNTLTVPETFDAVALAKAADLAADGDQLLADAITRTREGGRVAQELAGAPELLKRYEHATPAARALLEVAMDARRLGVGLHLPRAFLTDAAADYFNQDDYDQLTDDWSERAYAELAEPVHGKHASLRCTTLRPARRPPNLTTAEASAPSLAEPIFRLADYLEQHGHLTRRQLCPPASFWHAAHTHLTNPRDLDNLAKAAEDRHRLQWAHSLRLQAAEHGSIGALYRLALRREEAGCRKEAECLLRRAAEHGSAGALYRLAAMREEAGCRKEAECLLRQATDQGSIGALRRLVIRREMAGDWEGAEALARRATDYGDASVQRHLFKMRIEAERWGDAEALAQQIADHGDTSILHTVAEMWEEAGSRADAERLLREAADRSDTRALYRLVVRREMARDYEGAEVLACQAADLGDTGALYRLVDMRGEAGDGEGAERVLRQAAEHGSAGALYRLAEMREKAGDGEGAERFLGQAADRGHTRAVLHLVELRVRAGDGEGAERVLRQAADDGNTDVLYRLAKMREEAGDGEGAEALARQAAIRGHAGALRHLANMRVEAGDEEGAEVLARQIADHGDTDMLRRLAEMRARSGDWSAAEALARRAADHGDTDMIYRLVEMREGAGDQNGAEALAWQAGDHGSIGALYRLAVMREGVGDREGAEALARQAADYGATDVLYRMAEIREEGDGLWPYGLDPDGTPTPPWQPSVSTLLDQCKQPHEF